MKRMNKLFIIASVLALTMGLSGCSKGDDFDPSLPDPGEQGRGGEIITPEPATTYTDTDTQLYYTLDANNNATITGWDDPYPHTDILSIPEEVTDGEHPGIVTGIVGDGQLAAFWQSNGIMGNHNIKTLVLPSTLTSIGDFAFTNCAFTTLQLPDNLISIGTAAFSNCLGLNNNNLVIPSTVTSIGYAAFLGCNYLTGDIIVPAGVTRVEGGSFAQCSRLNSITYKSLTLDFNNETPETLLNAYQGQAGWTAPFEYCSNLTKIDMSAATSSDDLTTLSRTSPDTDWNKGTFFRVPSATTVYLPQDLDKSTSSIPYYSAADDVNYVWATTK